MGKLIFASALLLLTGCSATAPVPNEHKLPHTPGSRPYNFDCDSEAGKYSEWNGAVSGTNPWITGYMQVVTLRPSPEWPPDAGVVLAGPSKLPRVGLETFVLPDKPGILQIAVRGTGGSADHTVFTSMPLSDARIRFTLQVNDSGQLSLSVGNATTTLPIGSLEITRANVYCSSAHVHFSNVLAGSDW
jgi:hypothetical protein